MIYMLFFFPLNQIKFLIKFSQSFSVHFLDFSDFYFIKILWHCLNKLYLQSECLESYFVFAQKEDLNVLLPSAINTKSICPDREEPFRPYMPPL